MKSDIVVCDFVILDTTKGPIFGPIIGITFTLVASVKEVSSFKVAGHATPKNLSTDLSGKSTKISYSPVSELKANPTLFFPLE